MWNGSTLQILKKKPGNQIGNPLLWTPETLTTSSTGRFSNPPKVKEMDSGPYQLTHLRCQGKPNQTCLKLYVYWVWRCSKSNVWLERPAVFRLDHIMCGSAVTIAWAFFKSQVNSDGGSTHQFRSSIQCKDNGGSQRTLKHFEAFWSIMMHFEAFWSLHLRSFTALTAAKTPTPTSHALQDDPQWNALAIWSLPLGSGQCFKDA